MIGQKLAHYEVIDKIGAGGMGEVYRARDPQLDRDVAIKILPEMFSQDAERLARFEREAKLLASLNHPGIAVVHGLHQQDNVRFLAMELVPGGDLATRLDAGRLDMDEALSIARQVAEALEAAHEQGVIHRDLKPGNIMLTPDGRAKVLDFGLAKSLDPSSSSDPANLTQSPTMTSPATMQGVMLGTAAYMSPEQARGRPVDRRTDMWAFGVVLWEMLTGNLLFAGETVSDSVASILRKDLNHEELPVDTPPSVRRLIRRCLERDPAKRQRSAGDAVLELDEREAADADGPVEAIAPAASRRREVIAWLVAAAAVVALIAGLMRGNSPAPADSRSASFEIRIPEGTRAADAAISPDGRCVAIEIEAAVGEVGVDVNAAVLYIRDIDGFDLRPVERGGSGPFWSPDSRYLCFFADGFMKRMDPTTGIIESLVGGTTAHRGGSWGKNGDILYAPDTNSPIHLAGAGGSAPRAITEIDTSLPDVSHRWPVWHPDGEHFVYTLWSNSPEVKANEGGVYLASVQGGEPRKVLDDDTRARIVGDDTLVFHRQGRLMAVRLDLDSGGIVGDAWTMGESVLFAAATGNFAASVSASGDLVLAEGGQEDVPADLLWLDRAGGRSEPLPFDAYPVWGLRVSPDERLVAMDDASPGSGIDVWIGDLTRGTLTRLTQGADDSYGPIWSPDARKIAYIDMTSGDQDVYTRDVFGTGGKTQIVVAGNMDHEVVSWSSDGRFLFLDSSDKRGSVTSVWVHDFETGETRALLTDEYGQCCARLSPDGRWLAYLSDETGRDEVYVRPFPELDRKWQLSTEGVLDGPSWSDDGREIVYVAPGSPSRLVRVIQWQDQNGEPDPSLPETLFDIPADIVHFAPAPSFQRFLVTARRDLGEIPGVRVILNARERWSENSP